MFQKVLYPIDLQQGDAIRATLAQVLEEVRHWGAELYLVYVLPGFGLPLVASYFPAGAEKAIFEETRAQLRKLIDDHVPGDVPVTPIVAQGAAYEEIIREAQERGVDLIVIPSRDRRGVDRWLLGSTASKVVNHAPCAVLVLRAPIEE